MAYQGDTDRVAGELLSLLKGSLTRPSAGTGTGKPQLDDNSMLSTIRDFLSQSVPGMKPSGQQQASPTTQWGPAATPTPVAQASAQVDWVEMYRRQEQERQQMHARQLREREETDARHRMELESFAGIRQVVARPAAVRPQRPPVQRPQPPLSRKYGIVPGKSVGNWAVETESGVKTFMAVNDEQAMREARRYGLTPTSARLTDIHTYSPDELERMRSSFGMAGMRESAEAEFEQAIRLGLIPENSVFERLPNRQWGYRVGDDPGVHKGADLVQRPRF